MSLSSALSQMVDASRTARSLREELARAPKDDVLAAVADAIAKTREVSDPEEQKTRLGCYAQVLGELDGDKTVDLLVDLLDSEHAEVRVLAGEELEALAFDRFKEVALGVERALERLPEGGPALSELPYLLAEVAEPGCLKLIGRFLKRKEGEVVASAIEALVELGDPAAASMLTGLERDQRRVDLDDEATDVTVGELAAEARELLAEMADEAGGKSGRGGR
jgi:HEAT repeat protein